MIVTTTRRPQPPAWARLRHTGCRFAPRLVRFATTGIFAGGVQLALLHLWLTWGWHALFANTAAYFVSAQVNFLLSETFIWHDRRADTPGMTRLAQRWAAFHGAILGTAFLNQAVFAVARSTLPSLVAAAFGIAAGALINFVVQDRFVFGNHSNP